jgi:spermidine synthase
MIYVDVDRDYFPMLSIEKEGEFTEPFYLDFDDVKEILREIKKVQPENFDLIIRDVL